MQPQLGQISFSLEIEVYVKNIFELLENVFMGNGEAAYNSLTRLFEDQVDYENILQALCLNALYLIMAISLFYYSFDKARDKGTLINIGE